MTRKYTPYRRSSPVNATTPALGQKRHYSLKDQERDMLRAAKDRFVDLFGLTLWEECSMVKNHAQFRAFCKKHAIISE